jgi:hypothetical protein
VLGTLGSGAGAQSAEPGGGEPVTQSWSLAPAGSDPSQPGARANLTYGLDPGATLEDTVVLWNYSNVQVTFRVYPTDAYNTRTGAFTLLPGADKPKDVGTWVTMPQEFVTVPASTSIELPITITVPPNATPGDHVGAILAASQTPATIDGKEQVLLDRRAGTRIYLRVTGPLNPELVVDEVSTSYSPSINPLDGELEVTYSIRNTGNVRLGAEQELEVHDLLGTVDERTPKRVPEILPDNTVTFTKRFTGVAATVRVSTDVTVTPFTPESVAGESAEPTEAVAAGAASTTSTGHAWAIPWTLVVVVLVLLAVVLLLRRRRKTGGRGNAPGSSGPGGAGPGGAPAMRVPDPAAGAGQPSVPVAAR